MILSKKVQAALHFIQKIDIPVGLSPWETGRAVYEKFVPLAGEKENLFEISEHMILNDGYAVNLRVYYPIQQSHASAIVYFHGGWFNSGSLETHDTPLRQLSKLSGSVIISVDYRLAPEFPFPAGLTDCEAAVKWVLGNTSFLNIDPGKIIIMGDSAGGALAATITRKFRDKVRAQVLIYPVTDNSLKTQSWKTFKEGPLLDLEGGQQAWNWYLPKENDWRNPDAVPLLAQDLLGLPPTFVSVAEYDPLKDEALQYVDSLRRYEVNAESKIYRGTTHGFFQMGGMIAEAAMLIQDIVEFIEKQNS